MRGTGSSGTSRGHSHTTPVSVLEASHSVPSSSQPVGAREQRSQLRWLACRGGVGWHGAMPVRTLAASTTTLAQQGQHGLCHTLSMPHTS